MKKTSRAITNRHFKIKPLEWKEAEVGFVAKNGLLVFICYTRLHGSKLNILGDTEIKGYILSKEFDTIEEAKAYAENWWSSFLMRVLEPIKNT